MKITGSIVTYNNSQTIEKCIKTVLEETSGKDYDFSLYVYDNGSSDGTVNILNSLKTQYPNLSLIFDKENKGFGAGHNAILKKVRSDVHFVINPDIFLDMDTVGELADYVSKHENAGLVTPKILNIDGTEQYLPKYCPTIRYVFISKIPGFKYLRKRYTRCYETFTHPTPIEFCTGCFFGARTSYFKKMRGFNNCFFMYCEDTDLSQRVRADGRQIIFYPGATAYHNWQRDNTGNIKGIYRFLKSLLVYSKKWEVPF